MALCSPASNCNIHTNIRRSFSPARTSSLGSVVAIATRLSQQVVVVVVPSRRFMRNLTAVTHSAAMIPSDRIIVAYGGGEGGRVRLRRMWTIGKLRRRAPPARARAQISVRYCEL